MALETPTSGPVVVAAPKSTGFVPLKIPLFRDRWIASTVSSIGTWMQDTAGTWLMGSLTASPVLIGLMRTAARLRPRLLGLGAGGAAAVADQGQRGGAWLA